MTDIRADESVPLEDDDRLPWLEAVDEDEESDGPSLLKLIVAVLIGLVAIALIVGGLLWLSNRETPNAEPETIAAPDGSYKVKPEEPGGMKVEGQGESSYAASTGAEPKGTINVNGVPEEPVTRPPPAKAPPAHAGPAAREAAPARPARHPASERAPVAVLRGPTIQLGAFSSQAAANRAWKALSARFHYLAPLNYSVTPVSVDGRTLYRLRASGPGATGVCGRLRVAGETCVSV